jgi:hypothetical protein
VVAGGGVDYYHKTCGIACSPDGDGHEDLKLSHCKINNGYDLQENGTPYIDQQTYNSFLQANQGVNAILSHDPSQPMLMHFHTNAPHTPLQVGQAWPLHLGFTLITYNMQATLDSWWLCILSGA